MNITPISNKFIPQSCQSSSNFRNTQNSSYKNLNQLECDTVSFSGLPPKTSANNLKSILFSTLLAFSSHGLMNKAAAQNTPNTIKMAKSCNEMLNDTSSASAALFEEFMESKAWNVKTWTEKTIENKYDKINENCALYIPNFIENNNSSYSLSIEKNLNQKYDIKLIDAKGTEKPIKIKSYEYDADSFVLDNDELMKAGTFQVGSLQVICQVLGIDLPVQGIESSIPKYFPDIKNLVMSDIQGFNKNDASWVRTRSEIFKMLTSLLTGKNLPDGIRTKKDVIDMIIKAQKTNWIISGE